MADFVERTGKTVEEAIEAALFALHLPKERCTVEVIEEPSNGFFGLIGKRDAKVRVTAKEESLLSQQESLMQKEQGRETSESRDAHVEEERPDKGIFRYRRQPSQYRTFLSLLMKIHREVRAVSSIEVFPILLRVKISHFRSRAVSASPRAGVLMLLSRLRAILVVKDLMHLQILSMPKRL